MMDRKNEANKALEYYKKYCQNPDLIRYFTGPEASLAGKITTDKVPLERSENINLAHETGEPHNSPNENCEHEETEKNHSRSSSVASNKIEWDNGADIGYKNSHQFISSRKSASFPNLLSKNISVNKMASREASEKSACDNIEELRKMYHQLTFSSDTSSSTNKNDKSEPKEQSSTSSSSQENKIVSTNTKSSSSSDSYLKKRIGYPVAYSTPHDDSSSKGSKEPSSKTSKQSSSEPEAYTVTPMLTLPSKPKRNLNNDNLLYRSETEKIDTSNNIVERKKIKREIQKRIKLCLTKPVSLECISLKSTESVHKDVQTSFSSEKSSKSIQTEEIDFNYMVPDPVRYTPHTQNVEYVNFVDTNESSERHANITENSENADAKNCKATQTDFLVNSAKPVKSAKENKDNTMQHVKVPKGIIYQDSTETSSDSNSMKNSKNFCTEEMLLAEMISLNHSSDLTTDIKRSINILQKLLKSRKYDQATKKYYIKKIVQKIVDSKYSDDSTSSELFQPKKMPVEQDFVAGNMLETKNCKSKAKLMDNLPWYPASDHIPALGKRRSETEKTSDNQRPEIVEKYSKESGKNLTSRKQLVEILDGKIVETAREPRIPSGSSNLLEKNERKRLENILNPPEESSHSSVSSTNPTREDRNKYFPKEPRRTEKGLNPPKMTSHSSRVSAKNPTRENENKMTSHSSSVSTKNPRYEDNQQKQNIYGKYSNPPQMTSHPSRVSTENPTRENENKMTSYSSSVSSKNPTCEEKTIDFQQAQRIHEKKSKPPKVTSHSSSVLNDQPSWEKENRHVSSEGNIGGKNWRTGKTLSEKLLENRNIMDFRKGQGDYLLHVAKNERHHQLSWINNEIEHLVKLKELLEKKQEKTSPDSRLREVISSLLKMKEKDMEGIPKNFEVFVCNSSTSNGRSKKSRGVQKSRKKTASLTPGYYTIETQLDPNGNLLDLTVFDEKGGKKYNYRRDGVVDDVSISSKNNNTEVKLKPKAPEFNGGRDCDTYKTCCECGEMFMLASDDSEVSLCGKCTSMRKPSRRYKECRACGNVYLPPVDHPDICICQECYAEEPEPEQSYKIDSDTEMCELCGRLYLRRENDSALCVCRRCKKELKQEERLSGHEQLCNICKVCGCEFLGNMEDSVCEECLQMSLQNERKGVCQKVTFSDPEKYIYCGAPENVSTELCDVCGEELSQCSCGPKFVPKTPKLIGVDKNSNSSKGNSRSHCISVQADTTFKKTPFEDDARLLKCPISKNIPFGKGCTRYCAEYKSENKSDVSILCPSSSQSSKEYVMCAPQRSMFRSIEAKNEKFPKGCLDCSIFPVLSSAPTRQKRILPRNRIWGKVGINTQYKLKKDNFTLQSKKSCQCCTCVDCGVQSKRRSDKNARCQCCVCENCSIQVSLDENGRRRKSIISKWCQRNPSDTKTDKRPPGETNKKYRDCGKKNESRSCESLDYPCKPLKPKVSVIKETSSEESLTCPSKKPVCPAIPPPCPGAGNEPCPAFPPKPCPNRKQSTGDEGLRKTDQFDNRRRSTQEILMPVTIHSRSPLQEVHDNKRKYNPSEAPQDIQTPDEVPSISSNSPPRPEKNHPQIQVFTCSTQNQGGFPPRKDCGCCLETCKCSQTATHEEKDIQCPAFRQCTCQTEHKEDANVQCNCKEHAGVTCKCDENDEEKDSLCQCKKSSSSSSSNSDSGSFMSCICCKKEKILKNLINKIQLCEPCNQVNRTNFYPHQYCDPVHSCVCYKLVERNLLCEFKQTLTELERLDIYQQYCEVLKNCKCCKECGCKCKLPKKFKNGCAYFLKLEDACPNPRCGEEGSDMGEEEEGEDEENYLPEVTVKVPNCRGPCARHQKDGGKQETRKFMSCPSIQNYLCTMKPEFVARAERRRRILKNATIEREENSEHRKLHFIEKINYLNQRKRCEPASSAINVSKPYGVQTKAYCVFDIEINEEPKKVQPRVFKSFKEMKELTRRRYLHLTEVKSKKNVYKEKRLREANRLLANTFTRRLQKSTLRGTVDIPWNVKVVSF